MLGSIVSITSHPAIEHRNPGQFVDTDSSAKPDFADLIVEDDDAEPCESRNHEVRACNHASAENLTNPRDVDDERN